jgi:hypothetical protein
VEILPRESGGLVNELVGELVGSVVGIKTQSRTPQEPNTVEGATVQLTSESYEALQKLAAKRGKNVAEALSDAVRLAALVHDLENGKILVERNGKAQELLLV